MYTESFADISLINTAVSTIVDAGSTLDIDKNGTVSFADITAMRNNVSFQLTNITIPPASGSGGSEGEGEEHGEGGGL
ncbi:MAG: hypothetical protein KF752_04625 [Pirellulaceae bacterium]|nr:hypothetical protein [Pirellulaceae bacterium]